MGNFLNNDLYTGRKGRVPSVDFITDNMGKEMESAFNVTSYWSRSLVVSPMVFNMCAAIVTKDTTSPHVVRKIGGKALIEKYFTVENLPNN